MEAMTRLLTAFHQLRHYCDDFFAAARDKVPHQIQCRQGCSLCCTIESVTLLEGYAIERYLRDQAVQAVMGAGEAREGACAFLVDGMCVIYPARPLICRTHGLLLYNSEDDSVERTCALNFQTPGTSGRVGAIDTLKISENLVRLNMAFMMIHGIDPASQGRVLLKDLAAGPGEGRWPEEEAGGEE